MPTPDIKWFESPHQWGRAGELPKAIVIHSMGGTLAGCDAWFRNPTSQVSAHYGVGLSGEIHQYVDESQSAWANGRLEPGNTWPYSGEPGPNLVTLSIETEDTLASLPVTDEQYASVLYLCSRMVGRWGTIEWLLSHRVISPVTRKSCAGDRWNSGRFHDLAKDLGVPLKI